MTRVSFFLLLSALLIAGCTPAVNEQAGPPNIILILADDMGYGDPGAYNPASKIPTPGIDRLAREGMLFTDAHSPSAVCTPTRYGVLTGRYAWRTKLKSGVLWGYSPNLIDTARVTVASLLQAEGYTTGGVGKWHLGLGTGDSTNYFADLHPNPADHGFDYYYGIPASLDMQPYVYFQNEKVIETPTAMVEASAHRRQEGGGFWRGGPVAPAFTHVEVLPEITKKSVDFIEAQAADDTPFFLYVPLSAPHTPWLPTAPFKDISGAGYYGDFAAQVDASVVTILDALDAQGIADNTLVVYTSDNGAHWYPADIDSFDHRANLTLRGQKADIWEGGHRVPFVVRWPGHVEAQSVNDVLTTHTDLLATFAAVAGTTVPDGAGEDSFNMLPAWMGQAGSEPIRSSAIHHSLDGMFAIRKGPWKLIEGRGSGGFTQPRRIEPAPGEPAGQLYNLETDPAEARNLYLEAPEVVAELQTLLDQARMEGLTRR